MECIQLVKDVKNCSGCGACMAACPKNAISMKTNAVGCKYPQINDAECVRCGKCVRVCGYTALNDRKKPTEAYAAIGVCDSLVENSASGGVFATVAKKHIEEGGMVAGAVLECNNNVQVYHILSDSIEDIYRMQGSKYVQSDAWRCYTDVVKALKEGKKVIFSGTPCQVSAIKRLTGNPDNLVTIDLICHGVPPLEMLNEYAKILAKRFIGSIENILFRDKSCNRDFCARIDIKGKNKTHKYFLQSRHLSFYKYFLEGSIYRENCYTCPYACLERVSDLTIGDYWGVEKYHGDDISAGKMPQRKDWSCILVNTEKGKELLENSACSLRMFSTEVDWIAQENKQLNAPSKKPIAREHILKNYSNGGYATVEAEFIQESGGLLRYYWRMIKSLYKNSKLRGIKKDDEYEDR